jgi:acyl-CoA reductase-like NAD-dependent aldehyde dehydrogenase
MSTPEHALPRRRGLYYGGTWHNARSGRTAPVISPADGRPLGEVAQARADDVADAVAAAKASWPAWRRTPPLDRARLLKRCAAIIREHAAELSWLDAIDGGAPIREMARDVETAAFQLEWFAGLVLEMKGATIPLDPARLHYTQREPMGVVARIGAFNHPFMFTAAKIAAPLAAGNAVIVKPAEQAPLSALRLAEILDGVLPPGILSILNGGAECGAALSSHPDVAKVALIGSVPTGKAILRAAAETIKPVSLELGGKNALIAFPDADPEGVAAGAVKGMNFTWCGQSCGSTSRVFLHETLYDRVLAAMAERILAIRPGLPMDPHAQMGAIISKAQLEKVERYVGYGIADGARLMAGGRRPDDPALAGGFYYLPTLFADVTPNMRIAREEIFGPVVSVFRWSDRAQMLDLVNDLPVGLTASIWTNDLALAHETAADVEAGYVWINEAGPHYPGMPFGGWKQSGMGEEESFGELLAYTRTKAVNVKLRP